MIEFKLADPLHIKVETDDTKHYRIIDDILSEHVDGYYHMPAFRSGQWDGKVHLFNKVKNIFPYGLLTEVLGYYIKEHPNERLNISDAVRSLFEDKKFSPVWDLKYKPWDYQEDCISSALSNMKGILLSATASGKSLMIAYIVKTLLERKSDIQQIIIVPTTSLIEQFKSDLIEYGIHSSYIGTVYSKSKEFDNPIVISTWQSLKNRKNELLRFTAIHVDEVHGVKANVLKDIVKKAHNASFRLGYTGTMPPDRLDELYVKSYLGPVLKSYRSMDLAEMGYVAKCNINMIQLDYNNKYNGNYADVRDEIFNNRYRLGLIQHLISEMDHSALILVEKVEKEGQYLEQILRDSKEFKDKEIKFLSGKDDAEERELWRRFADEEDNIILIATYGIFQVGVNIKSLQSLILASPSKSKIRVLQSIGRILRMHADKTNGATVWDIVDNVKYLKKHGDARLRFYNIERFDVCEMELKEGESYNVLNAG